MVLKTASRTMFKQILLVVLLLFAFLIAARGIAYSSVNTNTAHSAKCKAYPLTDTGRVTLTDGRTLDLKVILGMPGQVKVWENGQYKGTYTVPFKWWGQKVFVTTGQSTYLVKLNCNSAVVIP